jgi:hypothetical protein
MPRLSRATAHHPVKNAPTATRAPLPRERVRSSAHRGNCHPHRRAAGCHFTDPCRQISSLHAELADKPSRLYLWGVIAAMTAAYTAGIAAIGVLLTYLIPQFLHH